MGIYDRDYIRNDRPRSGFASWSMVTKLIVINVVVWVVDVTFAEGAIARLLMLQPNVLTHPLYLWQLLSYGFVHDPDNAGHVFINMLVLFMFGRDVEQVYGPKEFLRIYLSILISAGVLYALLEQLAPAGSRHPILGASGAITGIFVLFVCHFPNRQLLLYFVIPVPAWAAGIGLIGYETYSEIVQNPGDNVAHLGHLTGAFFGYLYYRTGWSLASLVPQKWTLAGLRRRTKLRVHREQDESPDEPVTQQRVDELLAKISREGESSLTDKERRELEEASRRYRGHQRRS